MRISNTEFVRKRVVYTSIDIARRCRSPKPAISDTKYPMKNPAKCNNRTDSMTVPKSPAKDDLRRTKFSEKTLMQCQDHELMSWLYY